MISLKDEKMIKNRMKDIYESIEAKGLKKLNVNNYYAVVNLPCKEIDG